MKKIPIFNDRPIEKEWESEDTEDDIRAINEQIKRNAMKEFTIQVGKCECGAPLYHNDEVCRYCKFKITPKNPKPMKEFTIGGRPRLQKAFAEVLGVRIYLGFSNAYDYLCAGEQEARDSTLIQTDAKSDTHFDLPAQWDEAMSYARKFYGMEKEEKPIEEQLSKMLGEDNARLRKAGCDMAEAAIRVINKYDGVHRLSLAVSEWTKAIADEGGRGEKSEPKEEKPPLPKNIYAITDHDGMCELFWNKDECEKKLIDVYKKESPEREYWTEEVMPTTYTKSKNTGMKEKPPLPESWGGLWDKNKNRSMRDGNADKFVAFHMLYDLLQAYWNAHDGWRPDWNDSEQRKICIEYNQDQLVYSNLHSIQRFLTFPTLTQAKHFLKHHIGLIEQARELL